MPSHNYDDIIHLPHHVSERHPQMTMRERAAQFAPFAALTGYDATLEETARPTESRRTLDEDERQRLDNQLQALLRLLPTHPKVSIEYFMADERKAGGTYITHMGAIEKISLQNMTILFSDGHLVSIPDIAVISFFSGEQL